MKTLKVEGVYPTAFELFVGSLEHRPESSSKRTTNEGCILLPAISAHAG